MAELTFRHTTLADVDHVAKNMRQADREEVYAAAWHTPEQALVTSIRMSHESVTAVSPDGVPLVIFGLTTRGILSDVGIPWLLGCDEALRYRREFVKQTPKVLESMLEQYRMLENYVHVKNVVSVRWLRTMGFNMDPPVMFPSGERFIRFWMER